MLADVMMTYSNHVLLPSQPGLDRKVKKNWRLQLRVRTHFLLLVKESHQSLDEMLSECATCHLWLDWSQALVCADVFELVDRENMKLYQMLLINAVWGCLRLWWKAFFGVVWGRLEHWSSAHNTDACIFYRAIRHFTLCQEHRPWSYANKTLEHIV